MSSSTSPLPRPFRSDDPGAILPRSASVALWLPQVSSQPFLTSQALSSIYQQDEPHTMTGSPHSLEELFSLCSGQIVAACAAFPVPGDVASAPFLATDAAVEAEEAVLFRLARPAILDPNQAPNAMWAMVPEITEFGSHIERGYLVRWQLLGIEPWEHQILGTAGSLADAAQHLRSGLIYATEALTSLDVAKWREEHSELIELLRDPVELTGFVPNNLSPRQTHVLQQSARLRAIVDLARLDEGGAINTWQADQRLGALREIDGVARRAMTAATLFSGLVH
ncbi:hypothetical protein V5R04_05555 [Jonesiaceae bacterium BS-20]|uniref:Uncharacterized protein n=1 Tax=Jonesiaceae bacterium BS-20 TaxID=3120821 RepID=A0AAU7DX25_9MICO